MKSNQSLTEFSIKSSQINSIDYSVCTQCDSSSETIVSMFNPQNSFCQKCQNNKINQFNTEKCSCKGNKSFAYHIISYINQKKILWVLVIYVLKKQNTTLF